MAHLRIPTVEFNSRFYKRTKSLSCSSESDLKALHKSDKVLPPFCPLKSMNFKCLGRISKKIVKFRDDMDARDICRSSNKNLTQKPSLIFFSHRLEDSHNIFTLQNPQNISFKENFSDLWPRLNYFHEIDELLNAHYLKYPRSYHPSVMTVPPQIGAKLLSQTLMVRTRVFKIMRI